MINNFCFNCGVKGHRETVCKKTRAGRNHVMQKFEEYKKRIEAITDRERTQYLAKTELTGESGLRRWIFEHKNLGKWIFVFQN